MPGDVALLLHMHQPDYRDPVSGVPVMPWVRLHAVRGYTDVATLAIETGARITVNVVPILIDQLMAYAEGGTDHWEVLSRIRAEDLDEEQRQFIRDRFVHGNIALVNESPHYRALAARASELRTPGELRDLQVWSNLAWMGFVARRNPDVEALREQGSGFGHDQLLWLMDTQRALVREVLGLWKQLPSISCTPYTHPILPLLVDFQHARRSIPELDPSVSFCWPGDAWHQLVSARERVDEVLGHKPAGLWPSEGSVGPEVADLVTKAGFTWMATCQGVLERSERSGPPQPGLWEHRSGLRILFRDRGASDAISFHYHRLAAADAVADLLGRAGHGVMPVVLDGENPWEAYPRAGEAFLTHLFSSGRLVDMDEAASRSPIGRIDRLHTGSWVNADLRIWAGHEADWVAWRHLSLLREAWETAGRPMEAWQAISAAEGSDWFWWYGPDFDTPFHDLFDRLFRDHLKAGWRALSQPIPDALCAPLQTR